MTKSPKLRGRYVLLVVLIAANAGLAAWVRHRARAADRTMFAALLRRVSASGEARLSRARFLREGGTEAEFDRYDANRDGYLDAAEFRAAFEREEPEFGPAPIGPPP